MKSNQPLIFISPSKTMKEAPCDTFQEPIFNDLSQIILDQLQKMKIQEIQKMMKTSDKLTDKTYHMILNHEKTNTAIFSYSGSVFTNLQPKLIDWEDQKDNLVIASSLYGLLKPLDSIGHYRLDYTMDFPINLKKYWQESLVEFFNASDRTIINLASAEYSYIFEDPYFKNTVITIQFQESDGKVKSTYNKIMRGKFAHALLTQTTEIKDLSIDGYAFQEDLSTDKLYVYQK